MILDKIIEEAKKQNLDTYISGLQRDNRIIDKRGTAQENLKNPFADIKVQDMEIQLSMSAPDGTIDKINKLVEDLKEKNNCLIDVEISQSLSVGNKLPNFGEIKKVFEEGKAELAAKAGQVLLIDVWATWCGPCQKPMAHNQQMLQKNNWGEKVRIVGVSVDQDLEGLKNRIQTKNWKKVEHLTLGGWDQQHSIIKNFNVNGIPFVCLADTKGDIVYMGHPSSINLENKINELLKQGKHQIKEQPHAQKSDKKQISSGEMEKLKQTVLNKEFFDKHFANLSFVSSKITLSCKAVNGKTSNHASIQIYVKQQDKAVAEQFGKLIPSKDVNFQVKIVQTVKVPQVPKQCADCKKQLKFPIYWCYWSPNPADFRCIDCVEKKVDETHFNYKQNSILLVNPVKQITKATLGKNIQPDKPIENLDSHSFGCNGCGGGGFKVGEPRYVCLGCRSEPNYRGDYVDLCEQCVRKYAKKDEQVIEALSPDGHKEDHPFLRILYNVKGYYVF